MNIFKRVADHANAHVDKVRGRHLKNLLRELLPVFVNLLWEEEIGLESLHIREASHATAHSRTHDINVSCQLHAETANLNSQVGDDGPLVTLQSLQGDLGNLSFGLPHKHLAGCS